MMENGTGYRPDDPHLPPERGVALETDISQDRITPIYYTVN